MGLDIGVNQLTRLSTGRPVRLSKDGRPEWLTYGAQIAWALVTAQSSDGSLTIDDTPYLDGDKLLSVGTIMVKLTGGTYENMWAPFVNGASDGQGTLTRDKVALVDMTIKQYEPLLNRATPDITGLIVGGRIFGPRVQVVTGATLAGVLAVMPRLSTN